MHTIYDPKEIYGKRAAMPDFCRFEEISGSMILCTVLCEDASFAGHRGYDLRSMKKAVLNCVRDGFSAFGGSTITQQLVKNLYYTFERSVSRKIGELFLARRFEKRLTKKQILELYLNIIYFDNGQYGIHEAAGFYFGRTPKELSLNQSFFLASILPVVGGLNPLYHPKEFVQYRNRRATRLAAMADEETISEILRHGPDRLDEAFCPTASAATDRYNAPGPMLNERFGIRGTAPLALSPGGSFSE